MQASPVAVQTFALNKKAIKSICANIKSEFLKQSCSQLQIANLLLELRNEFNEEESRFFSRVASEFGLKRRAVHYYLAVARAKHLHGLNLEFSKLQMLAAISEKEFASLGISETKMKKLSVRKLRTALNGEKKVVTTAQVTSGGNSQQRGASIHSLSDKRTSIQLDSVVAGLEGITRSLLQVHSRLSDSQLQRVNECARKLMALSEVEKGKQAA
jgi:hypothetical protein